MALLEAEYFDFLALVTVAVVPLSCGLGSDTAIDAAVGEAAVAAMEGSTFAAGVGAGASDGDGMVKAFGYDRRVTFVPSSARSFVCLFERSFVRLFVCLFERCGRW